jgi:hypothetical protein
MDDQGRSSRRTRDAGLATVERWTRRAVAGGVVLAGVLGVGLAHLLPGQAAARHDTRSPTGTTGSAAPDRDDPAPGSETSPGTDRPRRLVPPSAAPRPSRGHPHVTSGGS